ncbi:MAG: MFS transporter [Bdellovibrionota bacterium]
MQDRNADRNVRAFIVFRIAFNARFYYPVLAILFLDLGLSLEQYSLLNVGWAAAICLLEVPSGALADTWGRKKLVVIAGALMIAEMVIFSFTPRGNVTLMFGLFMLNRVLSGAAEACASGADEALVYDSLKAEGREKEWPQILAKLGRWQSVAFFIAMLVGAAVYDPTSVNAFGHWLGHDWRFTASELTRMPIYLTLILSFIAFFAAVSMRETPGAHENKVTLAVAFGNVVSAGRWVIASPVALFVILATLNNDAFVRLFMTMTSQYYRLLGLPEASFGMIGSLMALLGFVSPWIGEWLVRMGSARASFGVLSLGTVVGLYLVRFAGSVWALATVFWLSLVMGVVGFLSSYYLNEVAEPSRRATILSFRGLSTQLAYGGLGLLFAGLLKSLERHQSAGNGGEGFLGALGYLPWIFLGSVGVAYLIRWIRSPKPAR